MSTEGEVAAKEAHELQRALGPWQLIALGIGAIIGAGIFVHHRPCGRDLCRTGRRDLVHDRGPRLLLRRSLLRRVRLP